MPGWWAALAVLVCLENSTWITEYTIFQVRLEINIWEKRIEVEIESYKQGIANRKVIVFKTEGTS